MREPKIIQFNGRSMGKTYTTIKVIKKYISQKTTKGQPYNILIFDVNNANHI